MKRAALLAMILGCGGASNAPAKSRPTATAADACERICAVYDDCHIAPPSCPAACASEQKRFREGIHPALATCLERELTGCEHRPMPERREISSICFAAVLEAYTKDATFDDNIARAVCARNAKCATDPDPNCVARIRENHKNATDGKLHALVRPELLARMAKCIEAASCEEPEPAERCFREEQ